eukprot:3539062-Rhodomonas_salina.1
MHTACTRHAHGMLAIRTRTRYAHVIHAIRTRTRHARAVQTHAVCTRYAHVVHTHTVCTRHAQAIHTACTRHAQGVHTSSSASSAMVTMLWSSWYHHTRYQYFPTHNTITDLSTVLRAVPFLSQYYRGYSSWRRYQDTRSSIVD